MPDIKEKLLSIAHRRSQCVDRLVAPARAAANTLADANMKRTADSLNEILFEIDALDSEMTKLIGEDPVTVMRCLSGMIKGE